MQFVSLFAFLITAAWADPPDRYSRSLISDSVRVKRGNNDDPFSLLHSRITSLSRVVTGVSLINGLTDGSIPTDSVISELLNIPSIKDLENFDKKIVDDSMARLKDIGSKLSNDSKDLEEQFAGLHGSKEMWSKLGDLESLPDKQAFEKLRILETMDLKTIKEFKFETSIQALSDINAAEIPNVKSSLESLSAAYKAARTQLETAEILGVLNSLTPLLQFAEQFIFYKNSAVDTLFLATDQKIASFKANWQNLNGLSFENNLIPIEANDVDSKKIFTTGLVNGFVDMKKLQIDIRDPWIVNSTESIELAKGLKLLSKPSDGLEALDLKLVPLKKDSIRRSIKKMNFFRENLKAIKGKESVLDTSMVSMKKCQFVLIRTQVFTESVEVVSYSKKLIRNVQSILKISTSLEEGSDTIAALDAMNPETIAAVLNLMENLRYEMEEVTSGGTNEAAKQLLTHTVFVTEFESILASGHSTFFNCIKEATPDSEVLSTVAKLIIDLKNIGSDAEFFANIETAGSAIVGSASDIQNVRKSLKIEKTLETKKLALLKDLNQYSTPIGEASATVTSIQNLLEKNQDVLDVVNYARIVGKGVEAISNEPGLQYEIRNGWDGFEERSNELVALIGVVKSRVGSLKESINLESLGKGLEGFAGLGDVDLGVRSRKDALELLISKLTAHQSLKTGLEKLKESLSHLEGLDLKFSKFDSSLSEMSKTMAGLKMVFVNGAKAAVTVPPTTAPRKNTTIGMSGLKEEATTENKGGLSLETIVIIIGVVIIVVTAIVFIVLAVIFKWCCFKTSKKPNPNSKKSRKSRKAKKSTGSGSKDSGSKSTKTAKAAIPPINASNSAPPPSPGPSAQNVAPPPPPPLLPPVRARSASPQRGNQNRNQEQQPNPQERHQQVPQPNPQGQQNQVPQPNPQERHQQVPQPNPQGQQNQVPPVEHPNNEQLEVQPAQAAPESYLQSQSDDVTMIGVKSIEN
ncbi:unnamed protein product [Caenorhabditis nigoni]